MPLTPSQKELHDRVVQGLAEAGADDLARRDGAFEFDRALWNTCAGLGLAGPMVPEKLGGQGMSASDAVVAMEALGYACKDNGLALALGAHGWGCLSALLAGNGTKHADLIRQLARGELIGALAVTEPDAGSDIGAIETTAVRTENGYRLSGRKVFITNAPIADVFVILARTGDIGAAFGLSAFCVRREIDGLQTSQNVPKMGLRTAQMGDVVLNDCHVPESARIGAEGGGLRLFLKVMEFERGFILAPAIGAMQRLYEQAADYARSRRQFGRPIADFQSVSKRLVDMYRLIEAARLVVRETALQMDAGQSIAKYSALAKLTVSENWVQVAQEAMHVFGGAGFLMESEIERELRDAQGSLSYSGTSEIQYRTLAHLLKLTAE
ncbi:acyl-CoA/acyl-ACP dehydrogenase [Aurantiacibacter sp. MUD11]|uniref:acyl-CoA dehydrogenase family protein n=1 Tax=Aurantiacibacter sp. MUD11 TaxID=3003265 RepID=UPI0022AA2895|nr:acyl-CoA dehydrogenase family protein [Aurantiacibacter sp. MUD11]WAT18938.1 acyl-CoA/acyl-ACP dehydrogenase [Aurantiacibacter sp. MUD11]